MGVVDYNRDLYCIAGLPFDAITLKRSFELVYKSVIENQTCFLSTPNLNFLIACQNDEAFRDSVINSDLSIADGMPIVWMARLLGLPVAERVAGSTLFEYLGSHAEDKKQIKVFFFGGEDGVAEIACQKLQNKLPGMACTGFIGPGFVSIDQLSKPEYIQQINESGADFLLVALGAKKGQAWLEKNRSLLTVPVYSHLGAVINFVAGSVKRSPKWMQNTGLEWLWRIKEEPDLWKRYWLDGVGLLRLLLTQVLPYAVWLRINTKAQAAKKSSLPQVNYIEGPGRIRLILSGCFTKGNFDNLRAAFQTVSSNSSNVVIDCLEIEYIDASFVGIIQLFVHHMSNSGKHIKIINLSAVNRRIFDWCGARYLI